MFVGLGAGGRGGGEPVVLNPISGWLSSDLAIDLSTAITLIYVTNQAVCAGLAVGLPTIGGLFSARINAEHYPAGAIAFMKSQGLHGNVLHAAVLRLG